MLISDEKFGEYKRDMGLLYDDDLDDDESGEDAYRDPFNPLKEWFTYTALNLWFWSKIYGQGVSSENSLSF